jgi:hypothetical protein
MEITTPCAWQEEAAHMQRVMDEVCQAFNIDVESVRYRI